MISSWFILLMICVMLLCVILIFLILSQNPKGGGLSGTFGGGGTQMFGVQKTNEFMDKATWTITAIIVSVIIISNTMIATPDSGEKVEEDDIEQAEQQGTSPTSPTAKPTATK